VIKLIEVLQVVSAFGFVGTFGEMEVNYEMTIGEGALQAVLFLVGILLLEVVKRAINTSSVSSADSFSSRRSRGKSNYPKQKQKSAPDNHTHFLFTWRPKYNTKEKICQGVGF